MRPAPSTPLNPGEAYVAMLLADPELRAPDVLAFAGDLVAPLRQLVEGTSVNPFSTEAWAGLDGAAVARVHALRAEVTQRWPTPGERRTRALRLGRQVRLGRIERDLRALQVEREEVTHEIQVAVEDEQRHREARLFQDLRESLRTAAGSAK